jgi:sigma-E factor negative regulatory protein RseA
MTQPIEEQLSAFMDGELGRDEARFLLRRAERDSGLVQRWTRYHVVRQALRRQEIVALRVDFAQAVMAQIAEADAAPIARNAWVRWGSGGAIAAAVAVAALMVTKPATEPEIAPLAASANPPRPAVVAPSNPVQIAAANTSLAPPLVPNSPIQTTAASFGSDLTEPVAFDPRLQSYLIRHYEAVGSTSQPDFVPYVLLVQPPQNAAPQAEKR